MNHVDENPGMIWIRKRHPQNLICYIAAVNLKLRGGTDTADLPTQSIILGLSQKWT